MKGKNRKVRQESVRNIDGVVTHRKIKKMMKEKKKRGEEEKMIGANLGFKGSYFIMEQEQHAIKKEEAENSIEPQGPGETN